MNLMNIISKSNGVGGLRLSGITMPVLISSSNFTQNQNGATLEKTSSDVKFYDCHIANQNDSGISALDFDGWLSVTNTFIHHSKKYGLFHSKTHRCRSDAVVGRFGLHLLVKSSNFDHNNIAALYVTSYCRVNISVDTSDFTNNALAMLIDHSSRTFTHINLMVLKNNTFASNKRCVSVTGVGSLEMTMKRNKFTNNSGYALNIYNPPNYSIHRSVYIIVNNTFIQNNATFDSLVSLVLLARNPNIKYIDFTYNYLLRNTYVKAESFFRQLHQSKQAIVYIQTDTNADVHHNIFDNPEAEIELYAGDKKPSLIQQAHHCHWGATDVNVITRRIIGNHNAIGYSQVRYFPFLRTYDFEDVDQNADIIPDFLQGHEIGGDVKGNVELRDTNEPYIVKTDISIGPGQSLSVYPGVKLLFLIGRRMYVQGKLEILGTLGSPVILGLSRKTRKYKARLEQQSSDLEGIIQVEIENRWYSICSDRNSRSLSKAYADFLCQASGYSTSVTNKRVLKATSAKQTIGKLTCPKNVMHLGACSFQKDYNCSERYVFQVKCVPSYWSGIHFAIDARRSTIKYAHFDHVGQTAIQSDVHRHLFEHIKITNIRNHATTVGIKIFKVDVANREEITNISMPDFNNRGIGIITHDSRISMSNIFIENRLQSYSQHGIYIKQTMVSIPGLKHDNIQTLCSFNSSLYVPSDKFIFSRVRSRDIPWNTECEVLITTDPGKQISVQVISGNVNKARNCGIQSLMFHDGHKNESEPEGVMVDTNGYIWTSKAHQAHIIHTRKVYYNCLDLIIQISASGKRAFMTFINSY